MFPSPALLSAVLIFLRHFCLSPANIFPLAATISLINFFHVLDPLFVAGSTAFFCPPRVWKLDVTSTFDLAAYPPSNSFIPVIYVNCTSFVPGNYWVFFLSSTPVLKTAACTVVCFWNLRTPKRFLVRFMTSWAHGQVHCGLKLCTTFQYSEVHNRARTLPEPNQPTRATGLSLNSRVRAGINWSARPVRHRPSRRLG